MSALAMIRDNPACLGKKRYTDECQARAAGMDSIEKIGKVDRLWVYCCPHCAGWHLTKKNHGRRYLVTVDNPAH